MAVERLSSSIVVRESCVGSIVGLDILLRSGALALLIFSGPLQAGAQAAVVTFTLSSLLALAAGAFRAGVPEGFSSVMGAPTAVLLPSIAAIAAGTASEASATATVFALLGATGALAGALMWAIGRLGLGRLARMIPDAVVAGFMSSTGVLLMLASVTALAPSLRTSVSVPPPAEVLNLILGGALLFLIAVLSRLRGSFGAVIAILIGSFLFFGWAWSADQTLASLRASGLLGTLLEGGGSLFDHLGFWKMADWRQVYSALPEMVTAAWMAVLSVLLVNAGIEGLLQRDVDSGASLRSTGVANILSGSIGGGISLVSLSAVSIAQEMGGRHLLSAWAACGVLVLGLVWHEALIAYTPSFATSGLMFYVGWLYVRNGLVRRIGQSPFPDIAVSASIVGATLVFGILPAIGFGLVATLLIFAITYGQLPLVRRSDNLRTRHSTVDWGPAQTEFLKRNADKIQTVALQGFLFFGSADRVVAHVRGLLECPRPPRRIILDFQAVSGLDVAAIAALRKLNYICRGKNVSVVLTAMNERIWNAVTAQGLTEKSAELRISAGDADAALEEAEVWLLQKMPSAEVTEDARSLLAAHLSSAEQAAQLLAEMEFIPVAANTVLIQRGTSGSDVFLVDSGRFAICVNGHEDRLMRVRSLRPGALVGEIASYLGETRTADVVAETDGAVYRLSADVLQRLMRDNPPLAAAWHRMIAAVLAERVQRTNILLEDRAS